MNISDKPDCPDEQTLWQFIQGRLEPPTLDQCEDHVSDCQSCHETLRGLDANDTLSQHVSKALNLENENASDTQAIDGLMQRLLQPNRIGANSPAAKNAEIMADRAAEVLRCIDPPAIGDDESLGTLGDYRLLRLIGAGGTGVVFQAKDESLDRIVALKVLRPSLGELARDRFIAEAKSAASIEHDNVVTIFQIGQQGRLAFIAMQWVPGETLESRLARKSEALDEATVREFVSQIAAGLSAAHQRQLIHRDIKPANIWICDETGRLKILDFGLARIADEESSLTQTGMLAGTPSFMSPEQARGMELDPRSDLFSLGCVMYLLLTDRLPFSSSTVLGTLQTIQSDSPPAPVQVNPQCDADLSDLTMSLLEKLPGNRMASADNLIGCLATERSAWPQAVPKVAGTGPVPALATRSAKPQTGVRGWAIAAILIGLLAVPGYLMAPQIFRIVTNQGELVINTSDENIKIEVLKNGDLVRVLDTTSKNSFDIASGEYSFNVVSKSENEFDVSPNSVTMTRGGKQLVTVSIAAPKSIAQANGDALPEKVKPRQEMLSPDAYFSKMQKINAKYGTGSSLEKRQTELETAIAPMRAQREQVLEKYGPSSPEIISWDKQVALIEKHFSLPLPSANEAPIYGGRNFEQWYRIAKLDREPETVSNAIASCAVLAEEEQQKNKFLVLLRKLVRKHGSANSQATDNGGQETTTNICFTGFLKAIEQLEPQEVVDFIQGEMEAGNERSLGFCQALFSSLDFNDDTDKTMEFHELVRLDTLPLMKRICDKELKVNNNLTAFLTHCFDQVEVSADPSLCKKALQNAESYNRPQLYQAMLTRFSNGAINDMIESDFFTDSTPGAVRESIVYYLDSHANMNYGGGGGGMFRGSTKPWHDKNRRALAMKILTKAIFHVVNSEEPKLEFESWGEIWFDEERVIATSLDQSGDMWWRSKDGSSLIKAKPPNAKYVEGPAANMRHLLSTLCVFASEESLKGEDREAVLTFVKTLTSAKPYMEMSKTQAMEDMRIADDLKTLLKFSKGEATKDDFTYFVTTRNNRGGSYGGGIF